MMLRLSCVHLLLIGVMVLAPVQGESSRRLQVGASVPAFTVTDAAGELYTYQSKRQRALLIVFLSGQQKRSLQAAADLETVLSSLKENGQTLDVVIAIHDPNAATASNTVPAGFTGNVFITADKERHLWGTFGVIAMPTVIVGGKDGLILSVKAGYGYDFAPAVQQALQQALGMAIAAPVEGVATLHNATNDARVKRHLRMMEMLAAKKHYDAALAEAEKARALSPEALPVLLQVATLQCQAQQGQQALLTLVNQKGRQRREEAELCLVRGWAHRLQNDLDQASLLLLKATEINPQAARAFYELGRVRQAQGDSDKALEAYRRALEILLEESG